MEGKCKEQVQAFNFHVLQNGFVSLSEEGKMKLPVVGKQGCVGSINLDPYIFVHNFIISEEAKLNG